jgi:hypothetical protein
LGVLRGKGTYPVSTAQCVWRPRGLRRLGGVGQTGKAADACKVLDWPLPEGNMRTWRSEAWHVAGVRDRKGVRGEGRGCSGCKGVDFAKGVTFSAPLGVSLPALPVITSRLFQLHSHVRGRTPADP